MSKIDIIGATVFFTVCFVMAIVCGVEWISPRVANASEPYVQLSSKSWNAGEAYVYRIIDTDLNKVCYVVGSLEHGALTSGAISCINMK